MSYFVSYRALRWTLLKVVYPFLMFIGMLLPGRRSAFQELVIRLNNRMVIGERRTMSAVRRLLLLLPHCLQVDGCRIRLTHNIYNCERCGKCEIKDLIGIAERHGIELFVATGGGLARRIVADANPDAVVAVACERDLSGGIADTYPLPVLGITNERPFGPCFNTRVDLGKIEEAVRLLGRKSDDG